MLQKSFESSSFQFQSQNLGKCLLKIDYSELNKIYHCQLEVTTNKSDYEKCFLVKFCKKGNSAREFIMKTVKKNDLEYYLTTGLNIRENEKPFLSYLKRDKFNQEDILEFLEKENILSVYNVDCMRYFNPETKVFELVPYEKVNIGKKQI